MQDTKYQQIVTAVRERIREGRYASGSRLPGVVSLGREFGVSHITSNRALNELERLGLIRRVERVGSFVREGPPGLLHIHIVVNTDFGEEQIRLFDYWRGISEEAEHLGATISTIRLSDPNLESGLLSGTPHAHGIILLGVQDGLLSSRLTAAGAHYVHLGADYPDEAPVVMEDRLGAARDVVAAMIEDGHHRVALVADLSAPNHRLARDGYLMATRSLGIGRSLIRDSDDSACADVVRELLDRRTNADAILVMGAHLPVAALPALYAAAPPPAVGILAEDSRTLSLRRGAYVGDYSQVETGMLAVRVLSGLSRGEHPARRISTPPYRVLRPGEGGTDERT